MTAPASLATLLGPRLRAARNVSRRAPWRATVLAGAVAGFWAGCFVLFSHVLGYFQSLGDFGPLLTQRLLLLLFATFFGILLLSNTVTALTTFYLAGEVMPLLASPLPFRRLHHARFVETLIASSWMVLLVGLPALLAYGVVYGSGPLFYLGAVVVLATFLVIPAALGILLTTALVLVFPARGTRDALLVGTGLLVAGIVVVIRVLEPERLAHPSGLVGFTGFLAGFGATGSPYLPTTWAAEVLVPLLGARPGEPLFHLGLLASTAAMLFLVSATVVERVFLTAWSRAQTGRARAAGPERALARWLDRLARPLPRVPACLLAKDVTVFLRDPSQWSQLLLLWALVAIYLYNFSALPLNDGTPLAFAMRDLAAILNLGLGAFVTTAIAVRFVYPMVSLEGHAWWILRTAPVPLGRLWWSKFWIGYLPLLAFAELLVAGTNSLLGVPGAVTVLFLLTLPPLMAAVVSLGLAFGASYPRFDTQNAAQIATGFGAILYMLACFGLIGMVVALEAWPVWRLLAAARGGLEAGGGMGLWIGLGFAAGASAALIAFAAARRRGLSALARLAV
jgi:ABC-2 type transport system permease protein